MGATAGSVAIGAYVLTPQNNLLVDFNNINYLPA